MIRVYLKCEDGHRWQTNSADEARMCPVCQRKGRVTGGGANLTAAEEIQPWWSGKGGPLIKGRSRYQSAAVKKMIQQNKARYEAELAHGVITEGDLKIGRLSPDAPDMDKVAAMKEQIKRDAEPKHERKYY